AGPLRTGRSAGGRRFRCSPNGTKDRALTSSVPMIPSQPLSTQAARLLAAQVAARRPKTHVKVGARRVDDYYWLREKSDPEVIAYLDAENRYTEAAMRPLEAFRKALYDEMLARILETDESVPYRYRGYWYYVREVEGLQYPIYCRRRGDME